MAESQITWALTLEAAADLSAKQYHLMRQSAANVCNQASDATNSTLAGVLQNKPTTGHFGTVGVTGISKVVVGAAITQGAHLTTDSSGRAITVTSGSMAFGEALTTSAATGEIISARIYHPVRWAGAP